MIETLVAKARIVRRRGNAASGSPVHLVVAEAIRSEISSGKYPVGSQLPPERQLAQYYGIAHMTLRRSLELLARKGMVARRHGHGTFVRSATDKMLLGLLFGPSLAEESAYFCRTCLKMLREQIEASEWTCRAYDGLTDFKGMPQPEDAPVYRHLRADLHDHGFHGVIEFAPGVKGLGHVEELRGLPKSRFESPRFGTDVKLDVYQFGHDAMEFLVGSGRRRIAVIQVGMVTTDLGETLSGINAVVRQRDLAPPRVLEIALPESFGRREGEIQERARQFIQSWGDGAQRPDALVVSDDIAMRAVALALLEAGIRVPHDVQVVCAGSEGIELHYGVPVVRYAYSLRELAHQLLEILQRRIQGEELPQLPVAIAGQIKIDSETVSGGTAVRHRKPNNGKGSV